MRLPHLPQGFIIVRKRIIIQNGHRGYNFASVVDLMQNEHMRTTIRLDDDVHEFATVYSTARGISLSAAINDLLRRAEEAPPARPEIAWSEDGIPMFPPTGKVLTAEMVKRLEEEEFAPKKFA